MYKNTVIPKFVYRFIATPQILSYCGTLKDPKLKMEQQ